ncbi:hypothetical protein OF117_06635 [Geodermatophilus sp. YIM 151500]|nr:hypothetical protein [Geodermatophilus sp. YIM 151500]MCV2489034.1 hypothetical protein [Geodermatophilus sp. YIM 151500]
MLASTEPSADLDTVLAAVEQLPTRWCGGRRTSYCSSVAIGQISSGPAGS